MSTYDVKEKLEGIPSRARVGLFYFGFDLFDGFFSEFILKLRQENGSARRLDRKDA